MPFQRMRDDISWILQNDPAAKSALEVVLCYSGLHALWFYRLDHWLWTHGIRLIARFLSQFARWMTGIEIHPGAQIGARLFIDHGMGVVVGETTIIGDEVTIYQGVTLGGTGKEQGKRHPTIGNGVVIGAGARVLGNIEIGHNSRIGAGSVVLRSIPDDSTVVGVPGHIIFRNGKRVVITDPKQITDPLSEALSVVATQVKELQKRVHQLEGTVAEVADQDSEKSLQAIIEIDYQI
ncbi:MAG TPA: serine O-acetyltransferase [Terriglobales bacterium]|jgi:serine O-acetyltransferase|nr:serine O-acetyltransferase [Terriglobales bacterium]